MVDIHPRPLVWRLFSSSVGTKELQFSNYSSNIHSILLLVATLQETTIFIMASEPEKLGFYDDIENLKKLCNFLRTNEGPPVREAVEMDKRVHYLKGVCVLSQLSKIPLLNMNISHSHILSFTLFKGEKLVNFLVEPKKGTKWPKNLPKFKSRQEAIAVCKSLCKLQFMHRSEKRGKGDLIVSISIPGFSYSCQSNCHCFTHLLLTKNLHTKDIKGT